MGTDLGTDLDALCITHLVRPRVASSRFAAETTFRDLASASETPRFGFKTTQTSGGPGWIRTSDQGIMSKSQAVRRHPLSSGCGEILRNRTQVLPQLSVTFRGVLQPDCSRATLVRLPLVGLALLSATLRKLRVQIVE